MANVLDALVYDLLAPHAWAAETLSLFARWVIIYDGRYASAADFNGNVIVPPTRVKSRWLWFMLPVKNAINASAFNWIGGARITTMGPAAAIVVVVANAPPIAQR
jgi:hypothetical protein